MRISINLAKHPFVELRPLFARLRLAMAGLAVLAIGLGIGLHMMNVRAKADRAQMDTLTAQTTALENERLANEARMREPQNRAVLERSKFLNDQFARKSFSWTAVMMDLERVLPTGVQVTSIEPVMTADGGVNIRLRVSGERELAVNLVRNLERSQRFLAPKLVNETAQMQDHGQAMPVAQVVTPGGVEFDILSGYNPLPLEMMPPAKKDNADEDKPAAMKPKVGTHPAVAPHAPGAVAKKNKAAAAGVTH